jgi:hypothetical protein
LAAGYSIVLLKNKSAPHVDKSEFAGTTEYSNEYKIIDTPNSYY